MKARLRRLARSPFVGDLGRALRSDSAFLILTVTATFMVCWAAWTFSPYQ